MDKPTKTADGYSLIQQPMSAKHSHTPDMVIEQYNIPEEQMLQMMTSSNSKRNDNELEVNDHTILSTDRMTKMPNTFSQFTKSQALLTNKSAQSRSPTKLVINTNSQFASMRGLVSGTSESSGHIGPETNQNKQQLLQASLITSRPGMNFEHRRLVTAGNYKISTMKQSSSHYSKLFLFDSNGNSPSLNLPTPSNQLTSKPSTGVFGRTDVFQIEPSLSKDQKIQILKQRKQLQETKLKSKLEIYSSVRPKDLTKDKERVKKEYIEQLTRHSRTPQLDHLFSNSTGFQSQDVSSPQTAEPTTRVQILDAQLPKTLTQSQQSSRVKKPLTLSRGQSGNETESGLERLTTVSSINNTKKNASIFDKPFMKSRESISGLKTQSTRLFMYQQSLSKPFLQKKTQPRPKNEVQQVQVEKQAQQLESANETIELIETIAKGSTIFEDKQESIMKESRSLIKSNTTLNLTMNLFMKTKLDNALTYMIRIGDKQRFEYLLNRGVYASCTDKDGNSAIHYCIKLESIEFLSYLFEGEYHSYDHLHGQNILSDLTKLQTTVINMNTSRRHLGSNTTMTQIVPQKNYFQIDALLSLDKSNKTDGTTPLHEAAKQGNLRLLDYLINVIEKRNEIIQSVMSQYKNKSLNDSIVKSLQSAKTLKDALEFTDNNNMTPLLVAAKYNHSEMVKYLIEKKANPYVQDVNLFNCLHYAVQNQNDNLVQFLVFADSENAILRSEPNTRNQTPESLDIYKQYTNIFHNIWYLASIRNHTALERLQHLLKQQNSQQQPDAQTPFGGNTPLHFAVMHNNQRALKLLVQASDSQKSIAIKNKDGLTPKDIALMYKSDEEKMRLLMILNKDQANSTPISPTLRRRRLGGHYTSVIRLQTFTRPEQFSSQNSLLLQKQETNKSQFLKIQHKQTLGEGMDQIVQLIESDMPSPQDSPLIQTRQINNDTPTLKSLFPASSRNSTKELNFQTSTVSENESVHDLVIVKKDLADLKVEMRKVSVESLYIVPLELQKPVDPEKFLLEQRQKYQDEQRLGRFYPDMYAKILRVTFDHKSKLGSPSMTSGPSLNSSMVGLPLNPKVGNVPPQKRKQIVEEIFNEMDIYQRKYIDLNKIKDKWKLIENLVNENESKRLMNHLIRNLMKQSSSGKKGNQLARHYQSVPVQSRFYTDNSQNQTAMTYNQSSAQDEQTFNNDDSKTRSGEQQRYIYDYQSQGSDRQDPAQQQQVEVLDHMKMASPSSVAPTVKNPQQLNKKMDMYYKTNPLNAIPESWEQESKASGLHESQSLKKLQSSAQKTGQFSSKKKSVDYQVNDDSQNMSLQSLKSNQKQKPQDRSRPVSQKTDDKKEKVEAIKSRLRQLFLNYCDYSLDNGEVYITYTNFMKVIRDAQIYDEERVNQNAVSILISKECNVNANIIKHLSFDQFLNTILRISEIKLPEIYKKHPKSALKQLLKKNVLPLLQRIESAVENQSDEMHHSLYTVSELTLKLIIYNDDTQVIFTDILPLMKQLYQMYFDQEINPGKLKKDDQRRASLKSCMQFTRDFEICPYLVHQKASFLIWYSVSNAQNVVELSNNPESKVIIGNTHNLGKTFTLSHFIIFLYRLGVIYFNHSQEKPQEFNLIKKLLFFMRKLENSDGFKKFMSKLHRTYNDSLTFLPSKDLLVQILKAEGVEDLVFTNPDDMQFVTKEAMLSRIVDKHLYVQNFLEPRAETAMNYDDDQYLLNIEDDLKKLFEIYCAFGEPMNTRYLKSSKMFKMMKEAGLIKGQSRLPQTALNAKQISTVEMDLAFKQVTAIKNNQGMDFDPGRSQMSIMSMHNLSQQISTFSPFASQMIGQKFKATLNQASQFNNTSTMKALSFEQQSHLLDRNGGNSGRLDFNQFKRVMEILSQKVYPNYQQHQAFTEIVKSVLMPLHKQINDNRCVHNQNISKLLLKLDNQDMINMLTLLHKSMIDIYRIYADAKGYMNFQQYINFCSDYDIFPDFTTKASLYRIFHSLSFMNESIGNSTMKQSKTQLAASKLTIGSRVQSPTRQQSAEIIDEHLFVESLALVALYNDFKEEEGKSEAKGIVEDEIDEEKAFSQNDGGEEDMNETTPIEKVLGLVERMANSEGVYKKIRKGDLSNAIKCNLMDKKDILEHFKVKYAWYFKLRYHNEPVKRNFDDIMETSSLMTEGSQIDQ